MLSILPATLPSDLQGSRNGELFPSQLAPILLPGVGMGTLHPIAVRCWNMLHLGALLETGQTMTAVSNGDDYRSYASQLQVFLQRYTPTYLPFRNSTKDRRIGPDGKLWYKRSGVYAVASPGTSNHGWGTALDGALWVQDPRNGTWSIKHIKSNVLFFAWLSVADWYPEGHPWRVGTGSNAESFGLSWELESEPHHLRMVAGDNITRRVRDMEAYMGIAA